LSTVDDFAVLETDFRDTPFLQLSRKHPLSYVGSEGHFMGAPKGLTGSVSSGIVGEQVVIDDEFFFEMSALVNPGNSGGPVVDFTGSVVGVVTALLEEAQGLSFIVPAFAVLGDPQYRQIVGVPGGDEVNQRAQQLRKELVDPRTRRIVSFIDQCYDASSLATSYDEGMTLTEAGACKSLKTISRDKPRVGLMWMTGERAMFSVATVLIDGRNDSYFNVFVKRYAGPTRYDILRIEKQGESNGQLLPAVARKTVFSSDWGWLNAAPADNE
jgi:hypothetical protein